MNLAKVIGTVVATKKYDSLEKSKLLLVQPVTFDKKPKGDPIVAFDSTQAGAGEYVIWISGSEASFPFERDDTPSDCTILGIVDTIDLD